jgi:hypothetical protein
VKSCLDDAHFTACANLDGSVSDVVLSNGVEQPFLLMRSELVDGTLGTSSTSSRPLRCESNIAGAKPRVACGILTTPGTVRFRREE